MGKLVNLFYLTEGNHGILKSELNGIPDHPKTSIDIMHRQLVGKDKVTASFYYGNCSAISKTRAKKAAKVFLKQMNTYYPIKLNWNGKTK